MLFFLLLSCPQSFNFRCCPAHGLVVSGYDDSPRESPMIFINHMKSAKAAKDYYSQHIAPGDGHYYANDAAELKGIWHGRAAGMLGLSGEVTQKDFFTLCDNINPEPGKQL